MERVARARFWVFRINRWSLALALLIVLAVLLLPSGRFLPVMGAEVVKPGVTMLGREFSGVTEAEARDMLTEMASLYQSEPVPALEQKESGVSFVVPPLDGYTLDVDATWDRLAHASANSTVEPALKGKTSVRKLADYPQSVIRQGNPNRRMVGLFINVDVGWGMLELPSMLTTMKRHGVKATFFVSGRWAAANPLVLKRMIEDGHEVASHGHDLSTGPKDLAQRGKLKADLEQSVATIEKIAGTKVQYYAPHMSEVSPEIVKTAAGLNLRTVLYSLDTVDWRPETTDAKVLATLAKAKSGDLILMHPKPATARVLDQALKAFKERGLRPVTLSEMLSPTPEEPSAASSDDLHH